MSQNATPQIKSESIKMVPIKELKPWPKNRNKHSKEQIERLTELIQYQGFRNPVVVCNQNGFVVAGHGRLMAAKKLKMKEVPTIYQDFDSDEQIYAYMVSDNAIASWAELDLSGINTDIIDLGPELDINLLGIKNFEIDIYDREEPMGDPDAIPDKVEPKAKLGDIYQLGQHRLMCGDSTDVNSVDALINGHRIDMVHTDPPYGINESAGKRQSRETNSLAKSNKHLKEFKDDSIQYAIDAWNLCQGYEIPIQVWWGANYYCHSLPQSNNWLVWDKRVEEKQNDVNSDCELAWVQNGRNSVRIFRHLWKGLMKGSEKGESRVHPTQKPIALPEWCFEKYGDGAKTILDLFGGSGSTLIACEKTNRKCFMMELDPHYIDVIIARWEKYTGKTAELING